MPACASPLLCAREIEPHDSWHLGNFPQVFSHLALINACVHLIPEECIAARVGHTEIMKEIIGRGLGV